jgi:hypothetical protein
MYPYAQASSSITEQRHDLAAWLVAWRQWQDRAVADLRPTWAVNHQIMFDLELTPSELERAGAPPVEVGDDHRRPPVLDHAEVRLFAALATVVAVVCGCSNGVHCACPAVSVPSTTASHGPTTTTTTTPDMLP